MTFDPRTPARRFVTLSNLLTAMEWSTVAAITYGILWLLKVTHN